MHDAADNLMSAEKLLSIAGALWAFFGVAAFFLIKDVILSDKLSSLRTRAADAIIAAIRWTFVVNFSAVLLFQTVGVIVATKDMSQDRAWLVPITWMVHVVLIGGYVMMAFFLDRAFRASLPDSTEPKGRR